MSGRFLGNFAISRGDSLLSSCSLFVLGQIAFCRVSRRLRWLGSVELLPVEVRLRIPWSFIIKATQVDSREPQVPGAD